MLDNITSLQTETIVLLTALALALINALVAALRAESWMKLGKKALTAQNFNSAIHYFTKEIGDNPNKSAAYLLRAEAYRLNDEPMKALKDKRLANKLMAQATSESPKRKSSGKIASLSQLDKKYAH